MNCRDCIDAHSRVRTQLVPGAVLGASEFGAGIEANHGPAQVDFVAWLQDRSSCVAVHGLAETGANDPEAAVFLAFVGAVVEKAALSGFR